MRTPASGGGRSQLAGRAGNDDTRDTSSSVAQCVTRLPVSSLTTVVADYFDVVFGERSGFLAVAFGHDPYRDATGCYRHRRWIERRYPWPAGRDQLTTDVTRRFLAGERVDVYVCPASRHTDGPRRKGSALPPMVCWADLDGPAADEQLLVALDPLIVESGSDGHRHLYVPLSRPVELGTWNLLQRALRDALGSAADAKIADNDLLRLPGTRNHKSDPPTVVTPLPWPGQRWDPDELAELLGVDLSAAVGAPSPLTGSVLITPEPVPDPLPEWVRAALTHPDTFAGVGKRSAAHHRLIGACYRAGFTQGQTLTVAAGYTPSAAKYGERLATEVARSGTKTEPTAVGQRMHTADGAFSELTDGEPPADDDDEPGPTVHQLEVAAELRRLRVRQEARRQLAAETSCTPRRPALVLLSDLLAEPDETTEYRIHGLLPIDARVVLSAQFKAGKTALIGNTIRSLVDGDPFLGVHQVTTTRRRVVVVDTEMSRKTLRRWLRDQQIRDPDRVGVEALRGLVSSLDVLDPVVRREWAGELRALDPGVLILDCLRPVLDTLGLDENTDAGRVLVAFDEICESAGVDELIIVHHMGHTGERSRGSSRLWDWPDVEWRLVRKDPDDPASPRYFSAYGRDVDVSESALDYDPDTRHLTLAGGSRRDAAADAVIPDLVGLLTDQPGLSGRGIEDVLTEAGIARQVGRDAVKRAIDQGYVTTTLGPKRSHLHYTTPASARWRTRKSVRQRAYRRRALTHTRHSPVRRPARSPAPAATTQPLGSYLVCALDAPTPPVAHPTTTPRRAPSEGIAPALHGDDLAYARRTASGTPRGGVQMVSTGAGRKGSRWRRAQAL